MAIDKCGAGFLSRLTHARRRAYEASMKKCTQQFAREEGTIAFAEDALCRESVAAAYASRAVGRSRWAAKRRARASPATPGLFS